MIFFSNKKRETGLKIALLLLLSLLLVGCGKDAVYNKAEHTTINGTVAPTLAGDIDKTPTEPADNTEPSPTEAVPLPTGTEDITETPTATAPPFLTEKPEITDEPTPTMEPQQSDILPPVEGLYAKSGKTEGIPGFSGTAFAIMDEKGEVLLANNARSRIFPASTIKMLTALTAVEYYNLDMDMVATEKYLVPIGKGGYWEYGCKPGMVYPMRVWLHMLMISSCGDAADVIAWNAGKIIAGSEEGAFEAFIEAMNAKAKELQLNDTYADNPIGLDLGDEFTEIRSTPMDIARLAQAYMKIEPLAEIVAKKDYTVPDCQVQAGKKITSSNYYLTRTEFNSELFTAIGTKSGQTRAAGHCYVATVIAKDGRTLTCACFGVDQGENSKWVLFKEMTALLEYCIINE